MACGLLILLEPTLGTAVAFLTCPKFLRDKQWRMHGSCAESVPGVQNIGEYFTKVITLANMYNIKEILNSSRITEGNQYPAATIQDAIVLSTTKLSKIIESKMRCAKNWLFEIRICFNKQFEVIDCPNVTNSTLKLTYPSKPSPAAQALRCDVSSNGHSTSQFLSLIAFLIAFPSFLLLKVWTKFGASTLLNFV